MNQSDNNSRILLIHDLDTAPALPGVVDIIAAREIQRPCIGCFGCWTKTPTTCVIRDGFETIGSRFAACDGLVVVSRCVYGGFSPAVKNVLDRCIAYILPFFTLREDGQMHHASRYQARLRFTAHFYGEDITEGERRTAEQLIKRNALNLNALPEPVHFHQKIEQDTLGRWTA